MSIAMNDSSANNYDNIAGWIMVSVSSIACILGASIVFIDTIWPQKHGQSLLNKASFLASSMALASGVLLFSALFNLLPAAQSRLGYSHVLFACYFTGIIVTQLVTRIVGWCTPDAIHSCGETVHHKAVEEFQTHPAPLPGTRQPSVGHQHHHHQHHHHHHHHHHPPSLHTQQDHHRRITTSGSSTSSLSIQSGMYFLAKDYFDHEHQKLLADQCDLEYGATDYTFFDQEPHDTVAAQDTTTDYFRIGVQTAVAICIHKFPEGLIMFVSNQASPQLGLSVCAAMSIHNIVEGFMIALPLFYATQSRWRAFLCAAVVGGLSQPFGAALGVLLLKQVNTDKEDQYFGIIFGIVSGMMSLIAIQSMLPQAIKADDRQQYVPFFFFVGIFLVGLASLLKSV